MGAELATGASREVGTAAARYERIYEKHYAAVLAYCLRRAARADAEDAAAEVFAIAWRRTRDLPDPEKVLPWLYGVAYRVLSHQWRAEGRRRRLLNKVASNRVPPDEAPDRLVVQREDYLLVRKAAQRLKPLDQEVLRLVMWEELPHEDVALVLGSTATAVKQRFHRAKRRLAKEFTNLGGVLPNTNVAQKGGES